MRALHFSSKPKYTEISEFILFKHIWSTFWSAYVDCFNANIYLTMIYESFTFCWSCSRYEKRFRQCPETPQQASFLIWPQFWILKKCSNFQHCVAYNCNAAQFKGVYIVEAARFMHKTTKTGAQVVPWWKLLPQDVFPTLTQGCLARFMQAYMTHCFT